MSRPKPPLFVIVLAVIYVAVGVAGFIRHFPNLGGIGFQSEDVWIELTEVLAVVCGVFMFLGQNWARWLAILWIGFHVVLSAVDAFHGFLIHCLFLAAIAWLLFRTDASRHFQDAK